MCVYCVYLLCRLNTHTCISEKNYIYILNIFIYNINYMNINIQATTRVQEMLGRFLHLNKMKAKSFISGKNGTKFKKLITSMPDVFKLF